MRALILTNEFPPHVYGGAGVHVDYLTRELRKLIEVEVRSFAGATTDEKGWRVRAYEPAHSL
ncbi:MAG: glycogen synthase, partial [Chloroflexi bacterium]